MKVLSDGTVVSSTVSVAPKASANEIFKKDYSLKLGIVTAIYYPENKDNLSKKHIEYDVVAYNQRQDGSSSTITYLRCHTVDKFGTPNNFERFTLQPHKTKDKDIYKNGAQVLVLAPNGTGSAGKAMIVGGYSYAAPTLPAEKDGQFYEWQFNGINIKVDKDGQYSLTFNTPIDVDLKKKDSKAAGTKIEIFKDGRMKLSDNEKQSWEIDRVNQKSTWTNGSESITIDKKNKKIDLVSGGTTSETIAKGKTIKAGKDHKLETGGSIEEKSGKDIKREATGNFQEKAGGNWQFEAGGNVMIKSGGNVMVQAGGTAQFMGTTNLIGAGSVPAAGVGISQCMGIGNLGFPVMSQIITGSATVLIGA